MTAKVKFKTNGSFNTKVGKSNTGAETAETKNLLIAELLASGQITDPASRRGQLLNAAARLFEQKGYTATTVRDIAAAVGILSGSIFHHFSSKEDILCCTMQEVTRFASARMRVAIFQASSAEDKLRACIRCELEAIHGLAVPGFSILVNEWRSLSASRQALVLGLRDHYEQLWLESLSAVLGTQRRDLPLVRRLLLGALAHTHNWFKPEGKELTLPQLAEQVFVLFVPQPPSRQPTSL